MLEEQWKAITQCDRSYDGKFFYAVMTTRIFCRPSCKSRVPNRDNVTIVMTVDDALQAGYRACKRCRPDQFRWPAEELVDWATEYIRAHYNEPLTLGRIAQTLHINRYHLHHTFKRMAGTTPVEYLRQERMAAAKQLLETSCMTVMEIAMAVGFVSAGHFSSVFRKHFGTSPSVYRRGLYGVDARRQQTGEH